MSFPVGDCLDCVPGMPVNLFDKEHSVKRRLGYEGICSENHEKPRKNKYTQACIAWEGYIAHLFSLPLLFSCLLFFLDAPSGVAVHHADGKGGWGLLR